MIPWRRFLNSSLALPLLACSSAVRERDAEVSRITPTQQARSIREFDDCAGAGWCPLMTPIPAGSFMMGSTPSEAGHNQREAPQRLVNIKQFAAGKFDVTRGQWAAFVSATQREVGVGCAWTGRTRAELDTEGSWQNLGFPQDDTHPVVCVSWDDVQDYLRWLSQRTGRPYRLLTEAEWEYAARSGTTTPYPWGDSASHEFANYGADACCAGRASGRDRWESTSPVGSFPPNAFGLYDMHGNVMQWVQDCFAPSYAGLPTDGSAYDADVPLPPDPRTPAERTSCSYRMLRGGDFGNPSALIRSASRNRAPPPRATLQNYRSGGLGFRVARDLP